MSEQNNLQAEMAGLTGALDVPLAPQVKPEAFDPMDPKFGTLPGTEAAEPTTEGEAAEGAEEPQEQAGNVSKALQKMQRQSAEYRKATDQKIDSILAAVKNLAPTGAKAASRLESLLQTLNGPKGQEMDSLNPGITETIKGVVEEIQELRSQPRSGSTTEEISQKMEELRFETYFARYPEKYKEDFVAEQTRIAEDEGVQGERLQGYMEAWFHNYVSAKGTTAQAPKPKPAATGSRGIVPATSTARRYPPDPQQALRSGRGNIAGVPFRK